MTRKQAFQRFVVAHFDKEEIKPESQLMFLVRSAFYAGAAFGSPPAPKAESDEEDFG